MLKESSMDEMIRLPIIWGGVLKYRHFSPVSYRRHVVRISMNPLFFIRRRLPEDQAW